jgi:signal transduction histidine kinase
VSGDDRDLYQREALGAFAHELRTPLTSIRMVLELARREGGTSDALVLDGELASMLLTSVDDLQQLADDLQEASRLERRKVVLSNGPSELPAALVAAGQLIAPDIVIRGEPAPDIAGPWDSRQLTTALAGFARSANRIGDGSGTVDVAFVLEPEALRISIASGTPSGAVRKIAADAGFAFFRARQAILAMGGTLEWARSERHLAITVSLPR